MAFTARVLGARGIVPVPPTSAHALPIFFQPSRRHSAIAPLHILRARPTSAGLELPVLLSWLVCDTIYRERRTLEFDFKGSELLACSIELIFIALNSG